MDILFQIHYEWNKELFCLYYQTQNRKYRRILLFFCGAVIIFSFCLCSKIGREMIMTMMILFVCAVILINNIYLRLATYIQMETALKQYGTGKRIMTIKKDEINVLVPESGKKIIVSFIEIMEIGTIKEYCWIRVINQLIFIRKENFVIGDIEDFKRFIKLGAINLYIDTSLSKVLKFEFASSFTGCSIDHIFICGIPYLFSTIHFLNFIFYSLFIIITF